MRTALYALPYIVANHIPSDIACNVNPLCQVANSNFYLFAFPDFAVYIIAVSR